MACNIINPQMACNINPRMETNGQSSSSQNQVIQDLEVEFNEIIFQIDQNEGPTSKKKK